MSIPRTFNNFYTDTVNRLTSFIINTFPGESYGLGHAQSHPNSPISSPDGQGPLQYKHGLIFPAHYKKLEPISRHSTSTPDTDASGIVKTTALVASSQLRDLDIYCDDADRARQLEACNVEDLDKCSTMLLASMQHTATLLVKPLEKDSKSDNNANLLGSNKIWDKTDEMPNQGGVATYVNFIHHGLLTMDFKPYAFALAYIVMLTTFTLNFRNFKYRKRKCTAG